MEPKFDYIDDIEETVLEKKPLENIAKNGQLVGFKYEGFGNAWIQKEIKICLKVLLSKDILLARKSKIYEMLYLQIGKS